MKKIEKLLITTLLTTTLSTSFLSLADETQTESTASMATEQRFTNDRISFEDTKADDLTLSHYNEAYKNIKGISGIKERMEEIRNEINNQSYVDNINLDPSDSWNMAKRYVVDEYRANGAHAIASKLAVVPETANTNNGTALSQTAQAIDAVSASTTSEELESIIVTESQQTPDATESSSSTSTQEPTPTSSPKVDAFINIVTPENALALVTEEYGESTLDDAVKGISAANPAQAGSSALAADAALAPAFAEIDAIYNQQKIHAALGKLPNFSFTEEFDSVVATKFNENEQNKAAAKQLFREKILKTSYEKIGQNLLATQTSAWSATLDNLAKSFEEQGRFRDAELARKAKYIIDTREKAISDITKKGEAFSKLKKELEEVTKRDKRRERIDKINLPEIEVPPVPVQALADHYSSLLKQANEITIQIDSFGNDFKDKLQEEKFRDFFGRFKTAISSSQGSTTFEHLFSALNLEANN